MARVKPVLADDVSVLSALADPIRLTIVRRLTKEGEVAGADLAQGLGISRALLCHHSGILVEAGVATKRKAGQTAYLRLNAIRLRRCLDGLEGGRPAEPNRSGPTATVKRRAAPPRREKSPRRRKTPPGS
jgi:DNA-binding transcriptional ArsR family regulator